MRHHQCFDYSPLFLPQLEPSKARIIVVETAHLTPHLETGLEITARLALAGYKTDYLYCGFLLPPVPFYAEFRRPRKMTLLGYSQPQRRGLQLIRRCISSYDFKNLTELDARRFSPKELALPCHTIDSLIKGNIDQMKTVCWEGSTAFGISVASSLISLTRNSQVVPGDHTDLVEKLAKSYILVKMIVSECLRNKSYDSLILFNGRFSSAKGGVSAAAESNLPVYYHERGSNNNRFSLNPFQPHDRHAFQKELLANWNDSSVPSVEKTFIANQFFCDRRNGHDPSSKEFVSLHVFGGAEPAISTARSLSLSGKVITYYSSSDDEFASIDSAYGGSPFGSQKEAFRVLAEYAEKYGHALVLRVHPNQRFKAEEDRQSWEYLEFVDSKKHILILGAESTVCSYELMELSDAVFSYGSTIGIEAVYWNRPSVVLGPSFYSAINASVYAPEGPLELASILDKLDYLDVQPASSYPYGYHLSTHGIPFEMYCPLGPSHGMFLGEQLFDPTLTRRHKIYLWLRRMSKKYLKSLNDCNRSEAVS